MGSGHLEGLSLPLGSNSGGGFCLHHSQGGQGLRKMPYWCVSQSAQRELLRLSPHGEARLALRKGVSQRKASYQLPALLLLLRKELVRHLHLNRHDFQDGLSQPGNGLHKE